MTKLFCWTATFAIVGVLASTVQADDEAYKLPEKADAAVITLDYAGGQIRRVNEEPVLEIRANGVVVLGNPWGHSERIETKITEENLMIAKKQQKTKISSRTLLLQDQAEARGKTRFLG